jgi:hypothetical protein
MDKQLNEVFNIQVFSKIWYQPRKVFAELNSKNEFKYKQVFLSLLGIINAFDFSYRNNLGDKYSFIVIISFNIIFGSILGLLFYNFIAFCLKYVSSWFKYNGNAKTIVGVLAYAFIPTISILVLVITKIILFGNSYFKNILDTSLLTQNISSIVLTIFGFLEIILMIWSFILLIIGLSVVNDGSIRQSIFIVVITSFFIFTTLVVLTFILSPIVLIFSKLFG